MDNNIYDQSNNTDNQENTKQDNQTNQQNESLFEQEKKQQQQGENSEQIQQQQEQQTHQQQQSIFENEQFLSNPSVQNTQQPEQIQSTQQCNDADINQQQLQQNEIQINSQQQQQQQVQDSIQDNMQNIQQVVNSLSNDIFMNENNLDGLIQVLMLDKPSPFDQMSFNDQNLQEKMEIIVKSHNEQVQSGLSEYLVVYEKQMQQTKLINLEKIMGILKSKKKEVYLKRISTNCCHHHHHHHGDQQNQDQKQATQVNSTQENNTNQQHVHEDHPLTRDQEQQTEDQINQQFEQENFNYQKKEFKDEEKQVNFNDDPLHAATNQDKIINNNNSLTPEVTKSCDGQSQTQYDYGKISLENKQCQEDIKVSAKVEQTQNNKEQLAENKNNNNEKIVSQNDSNQDQVVQETKSQEKAIEVTDNLQQDEQQQQINLEDQKIGQDQQQQQQSLLRQQQSVLSLTDISNIISLKFLDQGQLQDFNPQNNCITFKLNDNYMVLVKSGDTINIDQTSYCHKIPQQIFQDYIFPYFSAFELFKFRGVSKEWREMVREIWNKIFKREMLDQLLAAELCKEIEKEFKLVHLRNPFRQKMGLLLKAIIDLIQWDQFYQSINDNIITIREKKISLSIMKILGFEPIPLQQLDEYDDEKWEEIKLSIISDLRNNMNKIFEADFHFASKQNLQIIKQKFLDSYDLQIDQYMNKEDKNSLLMVLYLKQVYVFALIKNYIYLVQQYITVAKNRLDSISKSWPANKSFLEGAYKILLLRNVKIKEGKICNDDSDGEQKKKAKSEKQQDGEEQKGDPEDDEDDQQTTNEQLMKSIFNFNINPENPVPDFVIKKRGSETRIYLDIQTKFDIIINSIAQLSTDAWDNLQQLVNKVDEIQGQINQQQNSKNIEEKAINQQEENQQNQQDKDIIQQNQDQSKQLEDQLSLQQTNQQPNVALETSNQNEQSQIQSQQQQELYQSQQNNINNNQFKNEGEQKEFQ